MDRDHIKQKLIEYDIEVTDDFSNMETIKNLVEKMEILLSCVLDVKEADDTRLYASAKLALYNFNKYKYPLTR